MRVYLCGDQAAGQFSDQLLTIGDSKFPTNDDNINVIQLPDTIGTLVCNININELISRVFTQIWFQTI